MAEEAPRLIGRYVVEGVIGRGAMGVILRAHDPELDRILAIKLIARDLLEGADGAEYIARFQREARASSRCAHPNIVAVHDFGLHEGQPYLAMEFVDGVSLQAALEAGRRFTVPEAVHVVAQMLDALDCAHAAGIVHRDIKPANLLLLSDLRAKLADFGIARVGNSDLTRVGDMIGTPSYMSPEQCLGTTIDARTDLFSTGTVLHELLSGARAFAGGSMIEVVRRVVDGSPPPLPEAVGAAFPALPAVLARALAKQPEARFASAAAMARALRDALVGNRAADATFVQAPARAPVLLEAGMVGTIERNLAAYVGPIAGVMLRSALRQATTREALLAALAGSIERPEDRSRFLSDASRSLGGGAAEEPAVAPATAQAGAAELDAVRQALLPHIGPIAGVLVKRAAADGAGIDAVWERLAKHIDDAAERATFLARRRR
ncbi:serine/threonine-protein kinase [Humitalea rosea]|uniref:Serine/threonine-protein kinase n=1 Tax=Humitalea rosea TaxID=990373 RepID=A0A2W7ISM8_9PROT|nr:serine/threonine-protein kinase [Humitalea rosea]PZW50856.1 serine/threonine-protein kinase [Humitalea rosea]